MSAMNKDIVSSFGRMVCWRCTFHLLPTQNHLLRRRKQSHHSSLSLLQQQPSRSFHPNRGCLAKPLEPSPSLPSSPKPLKNAHKMQSFLPSKSTSHHEPTSGPPNWLEDQLMFAKAKKKRRVEKMKRIVDEQWRNPHFGESRSLLPMSNDQELPRPKQYQPNQQKPLSRLTSSPGNEPGWVEDKRQFREPKKKRKPEKMNKPLLDKIEQLHHHQQQQQQPQQEHSHEHLMHELEHMHRHTKIVAKPKRPPSELILALFGHSNITERSFIKPNKLQKILTSTDDLARTFANTVDVNILESMLAVLPTEIPSPNVAQTNEPTYVQTQIDPPPRPQPIADFPQSLLDSLRSMLLEAFLIKCIETPELNRQARFLIEYGTFASQTNFLKAPPPASAVISYVDKVLGEVTTDNALNYADALGRILSLGGWPGWTALNHVISELNCLGHVEVVDALTERVHEFQAADGCSSQPVMPAIYGHDVSEVLKALLLSALRTHGRNHRRLFDMLYNRGFRVNIVTEVVHTKKTSGAKTNASKRPQENITKEKIERLSEFKLQEIDRMAESGRATPPEFTDEEVSAFIAKILDGIDALDKVSQTQALSTVTNFLVISGDRRGAVIALYYLINRGDPVNGRIVAKLFDLLLTENPVYLHETVDISQLEAGRICVNLLKYLHTQDLPARCYDSLIFTAFKYRQPSWTHLIRRGLAISDGTLKKLKDGGFDFKKLKEEVKEELEATGANVVEEFVEDVPADPNIIRLVNMELSNNPNDETVTKLLKTRGFAPDTVTYGILIKRSLKKGNIAMAERIYAQMLNTNEPVTRNHLHPFLEYYAANRDEQGIDTILGEMARLGIPEHAVTYTILMTEQASRGEWEEAQEMYRQMVKKRVTPDNALFDAMMKIAADQGNPDVCRSWFETMEKSGFVHISPTHLSYVSMIKSLTTATDKTLLEPAGNVIEKVDERASKENISEAMKILAKVETLGIRARSPEAEVSPYVHLMRAQSRFGNLGQVATLFDRCSQHPAFRNVGVPMVVHEIYIESLVKNGKKDTAGTHLKLMEKQAHKTGRSISSIVKASPRAIIPFIRNASSAASPRAIIPFIRNASSAAEEARYLANFIAANVRLDAYFHYAVLMGRIERGDLGGARSWWDHEIGVFGSQIAVFSHGQFTQILKACKAHPDHALEWFSAFCARDASCRKNGQLWSVLIEVLGANNALKPMEDAFASLQAEGLTPSYVTYIGMMTPYARLGDLDKVQALMDDMVSRGYHVQIQHQTSLMYAASIARNWYLVDDLWRGILNGVWKGRYQPRDRSIVDHSHWKFLAAPASLYIDSLGYRSDYARLNETWTLLNNIAKAPSERFLINGNLCNSYVEALLRCGRWEEGLKFTKEMGSGEWAYCVPTAKTCLTVCGGLMSLGQNGLASDVSAYFRQKYPKEWAIARKTVAKDLQWAFTDR
ncbi:hypothetical protein HDU76_011737 [Blyttiomyces sp. JEL0837]|nr:hypothetical protein HDU76_011737 [Blyttiomyces sp. JEL0837]